MCACVRVYVRRRRRRRRRRRLRRRGACGACGAAATTPVAPPRFPETVKSAPMRNSDFWELQVRSAHVSERLALA